VRLHSKHLRSSLAKWSDWETKDVSSEIKDLIDQPAADTRAEATPQNVSQKTV
jgi:hypothetical protein